VIGYVYFIADQQGRVKIGKSRHWPTLRMKTLKAGNADRLRIVAVAPGMDREREFQRRFIAHHIEGEWFKIEGDLAAYIEGDQWKEELRGSGLPIT
jgi:hypothetical protein